MNYFALTGLCGSAVDVGDDLAAGFHALLRAAFDTRLIGDGQLIGLDTGSDWSYFETMSDTPTPAPDQIRNRFEAIYGEPKLAEKLSQLTGANRSTVFRWFETGFPESIVLILEFLEKTPQEYWPLRARTPKTLR
jgi:hypothetical protein